MCVHGKMRLRLAGLVAVILLSVTVVAETAEQHAARAFYEDRWLEGMSLARKTDIASPELQRLVGQAYYSGRGVEKNRAEGIGWFQKAGKNGDMQAQYFLGLLYKDGEGVPSNRVEAVAWFQKAARQGSLAAAHEYAMLVDNIELLESVAEEGYVCSQRTLGLYWLGKKEVPKGFKWLRRASRQGDMDAAFMLGLSLIGSGGVDSKYVDFTEGEKWLGEVVEKGNVKQKGTAALLLSAAYQQGTYVAVNYPLAVKWGERAGDLGFHLGYVVCFNTYVKGEVGVPKDLNRASRIVDKLERSGDPKARDLGKSFRNMLRFAQWGS